MPLLSAFSACLGEQHFATPMIGPIFSSCLSPLLMGQRHYISDVPLDPVSH